MPKQPCRCIDISHYQGRPDFAQVKAAGVLAMIHKATESTGYIDPDRAANCAAALQNGIAVCTYHFFRPGNIEAQMDFYVNVVEPVYGERLVIDHEDSGCSIDDLHRAVQRLKDISNERDANFQITIYSGHVLKEQLGSSHDAFLAENTDLWVCHYGVNKPTWPSGTYKTYSLWQYSDTGHVAGIDSGYVDMNEFNGSDENLVKWVGPAYPEEPPSMVDRAAMVNIDIETVGQVTLNVTINGEPI